MKTVSEALNGMITSSPRPNDTPFQELQKEIERLKVENANLKKLLAVSQEAAAKAKSS